MRLLYIHTSLGKGGITTVIINRLNYLIEHTNWEIYFLSETKNNQELENKLNKKIKLINLDIQPVFNENLIYFYKKHLRLFKKIKIDLKHIISDINPDIITCFTHGFSVKILPAIKSNSLKIVEFHMPYNRKHISLAYRNSNNFQLIKNNLKSKLLPFNLFLPNYRKTYNQYDYGISLTQGDLIGRSYLKIKQKQFYNPIDFPLNTVDFKERDNIILGVGRLTLQKNFNDLIEAINLIKNEIGNWKVHIYGEGELKPDLIHKIEKYELEDIIIIKKFTTNISKVYNNAKLLISTAIFEGQSMCILEALSYNIPVISYNCNFGPNEMIRNNVNGFLIDFDPKSLAIKISKLLNDEHLLNSFSENAKDNLKHFSNENILNDWIKFYSEIVNKKINA